MKETKRNILTKQRLVSLLLAAIMVFSTVIPATAIELELETAAYTLTTTPEDFIGIRETDRNSRQWLISFWVTRTFNDSSYDRFESNFIVPGANANVSGLYVFSEGHELEGYTILFDIRNNGSHATTLRLVRTGATSPPDGHLLIIEAGAGGRIVTGNSGYFAPGSTIELEAEANEEYFFIGWETSDGGDFAFDLRLPNNFFSMPNNPTVITANFVHMELDSDGDGLPDWMEILIGTDPFNPDTDGDGLPDGFEFFYTSTNPLLYDTYGDGISDADRDPDGDGLTNLEEFLLGTHPRMADTDGDGLTDYEEVRIFGTNPLEPDSDFDGLSDYLEIRFGMDPWNPDTLGDGILDGDRIFDVIIESENLPNDFLVIPRLEIGLPGQSLGNASIHMIPDNGVLLSSRVPGFIANAFEINIEGYFDEAVLSFELDQSLFDDPNFVPAIYVWDEDAQFLYEIDDWLEKFEREETVSRIAATYATVDNSLLWEMYYKLTNAEELGLLSVEADISTDDVEYIWIGTSPNEAAPISFAAPEQYIIGNILSFILSRPMYSYFSSPPRFIVLNKTEMDRVRSMQTFFPPSAGTDTTFDVVTVMDESSAVTDATFNLMRANAQLLTHNLLEYDQMGVITYSSNPVRHSRFITGNTDMESAFNVLAQIQRRNIVTSQVGLYDAILFAIVDLQSTSESERTVVLLSHGTHTHNPQLNLTQEMIIGMLNQNNITVHAIAVPNSFGNIPVANIERLNNLSTQTGGTLHTIWDFEDLLWAFDRPDIDLTDTDGDGIPDIFEKAIAAGQILMADDSIMPMAHLLDYTKADSDGDGLLDGEEIELRFRLTDSGKQYFIHAWSFPTLVDSDFDGVPDNLDLAPLDNSFTGRMQTPFVRNGIPISFSIDYRWFFGDNTAYNPDISVLSSILSTVVYNDDWMYWGHHNHQEHGDDYERFVIFDNIVRLAEQGGAVPRQVDRADVFLTKFGMSDASSFALGHDNTGFYADDTTFFATAHKTIGYEGRTRTIIPVIIRGTNATIEEWSSNFDMGANHPDYFAAMGANYTSITDSRLWRNEHNMKGLDVAASQVIDQIYYYLDNTSAIPDDSQKILWIMGHSRGGGISNIVGAYFERYTNLDVMTLTYTFASPRVTTYENADSFQTIFNIVNGDDFVVHVGPEAWGFRRFGRDNNEFRVSSNHQRAWRNLTGLNRYNEFLGLDDLIETFSDIIPVFPNDPNLTRTQIYYRYLGGAIEIYEFNSNNLRDRAFEMIPERARRFATFSLSDAGPGVLIPQWPAEIFSQQSPAYLMQLIASTAGGEINPNSFLLNSIFNVAPRFSGAKWGFVQLAMDNLNIANSVGLGGIRNPHFPETYYFIATILNINDFE